MTSALTSSKPPIVSATSSSSSSSHSPEEENDFGTISSSSSGTAPNYTVSNPLGHISGFTNYTLPQMRVVTTWKRNLADVFQRYGYAPMDTRPVEYACNLQLTGGVTKQIYGISRLQDGSLTSLGIPFDRTVPMAIMVAGHHQTIEFPFHRYDINWAFRGEHAKIGRYRAFIQADVDIIDKSLTVLSDATCIVTIIQGLKSLGVKTCDVYLNHLVIAKAFLKFEGVPADKYKDALRAIDKLKPDNEEEVIKELTQNVPEIDGPTAKRLLAKMSYRGPLKDFEFPDSIHDQEVLDAFNHLLEIEKISLLMKVEPGLLKFAPNLTRGLDYYTGVVFETFIPGKETYGSIASGGRYDDLVGCFKPSLSLQGVGGSIGVTRLFDVMQLENRVDLSRQTTAQIFLGYRTLDDGCLEKAIEVGNKLRALGLNVELNTAKLKVTKQLKLADNKGIPYTIMVMNADEMIVKDMRVKKNTADQTAQQTFNTTELLIEFITKQKDAGTFNAPEEDSLEVVDDFKGD